ncbi:Myblike DNAbinding domain-containing protein [Rhizophlyctis rosea]|nr:Myblike DNAbinding domain-containing protein [Rhizophlyctis rosea]
MLMRHRLCARPAFFVPSFHVGPSLLRPAPLRLSRPTQIRLKTFPATRIPTTSEPDAHQDVSEPVRIPEVHSRPLPTATVQPSDASEARPQIPDPKHMKRKWLPWEDAIVVEEVNKALLAKQKPRWAKISKLVNRPGKVVRVRWIHHLNPRILRTPWTKDDDARLTERVLALKSADQKISWVELATEFRRSQIYLRSRWFHIDPTLRKGPLTDEEDRRIRAEGMRALQSGEVPRWTRLGLNRDEKTMSARWYDILHPSICRKKSGGGGWTSSMDTIVLEEVAQAEKEGRRVNWSAVGRKIGKSRPMVMNHWNNVLNPRLKKGPWSLAERMTLRELHGKGRSWTAIRLQMCRAPREAQRQFTNLWKEEMSRRIA